MRKTLCLLIALPLAVPAQAPQTSEPTIRATTSEVLLDFVVRDKHANIIRNLRPDEIQVFEDGVPQKLRHFEFVNGRAQAPATSAIPTPVSAAVAPSNGTSALPTVNQLRDMSLISVVICNLDPRGRELTLNAMRDFAKTDLGPNTYVGVFTLGEGGASYPPALHQRRIEDLRSRGDCGEQCSGWAIQSHRSECPGLRRPRRGRSGPSYGCIRARRREGRR